MCFLQLFCCYERTVSEAFLCGTMTQFLVKVSLYSSCANSTQACKVILVKSLQMFLEYGKQAPSKNELNEKRLWYKDKIMK